MKCEHCDKELQKLNPPVEDYVDYKFCLHIFGWRLMLYKDTFEYGCQECMVDMQKSKEQNSYEHYAGEVIAEEIRKGNLIPTQR